MDNVATLLEAAGMLRGKSDGKSTEETPQEELDEGSQGYPGSDSSFEDAVDNSDSNAGIFTERSHSRQKPIRTAAHNTVEKKRRAYLSSCFRELQDHVPSVSGAKASNVCVLTSAQEYIKRLQEDERRLVEAKRWEYERSDQLKVSHGF